MFSMFRGSTVKEPPGNASPSVGQQNISQTGKNSPVSTRPGNQSPTVPSPPNRPLPRTPGSMGRTSEAEDTYEEIGGDKLFRRSAIYPKCFHCTKDIKDSEFVCSSELRFHVNCFKCALCSKKLLPGDHILSDRYLYCKVDCIPPSEKLEAPLEACENLAVPLELTVHRARRHGQLCFKCGLSTNGTSWIVSLNRVFHRVCFQCNLCKRGLTPSDHVMRGVDSYCRYPCYDRKFVTPQQTQLTGESAKVSPKTSGRGPAI